MKACGRVWTGMVILFLMFSNAAAQEIPIPETGRNCTNPDLKGLYVLVYFKETPVGAESHWRNHFHYEYLAFYNGQSLYNSASSVSPEDTPAHAMELIGPVSAYNKYAIDDKGTLSLYSADKIGYTYHCIFMAEDDGGYKKGDIILTGYSSKGTSELYKLYRHWY